MAKKKKRETHLMEVADKLLDKIEQAAGELDVQYVSQVRKEKEVFFDNGDSPKKATREVVQETESLKRVETVVDRNGLKQLIAALKDIQEIQQRPQEDTAAGRTVHVLLEEEVKNLAG